MRRPPGAFPAVPALVLAFLLTAPALAQTGPGTTLPPVGPGSGAAPGVPPAPSTGRNVAATGRVMPPANGRASDAKMKASTEAEMIKAQKAAEARNKAWDAKMRKTMGSICSGC